MDEEGAAPIIYDTYTLGTNTSCVPDTCIIRDTGASYFIYAVILYNKNIFHEGKMPWMK